jgi:hypothetical protein
LKKLGQVAEPRVETKMFVFVFSRKKFFAFREKAYENFCESFRENFPFGMRIRIQVPLECVSRSEHWWMLPKIFAKTIPGTKIFRENENFREM